jgi:hypothetical protein
MRWTAGAGRRVRPKWEPSQVIGEYLGGGGGRARLGSGTWVKKKNFQMGVGLVRPVGVGVRDSRMGIGLVRPVGVGVCDSRMGIGLVRPVGVGVQGVSRSASRRSVVGRPAGPGPVGSP